MGQVLDQFDSLDILPPYSTSLIMPSVLSEKEILFHESRNTD